jgi:hypothetical protein
LDSEELNLQESNLDSDDLQFRVEMEYYDAVMEKALVIAEKKRQRQEKELVENDSELSVLASSLFKGVGGVESDNVEMGRTGNTLTDQDNQEDGVDSRVSVQGTGTSPKRPRSGKLLDICISEAFA